MDSGKKIKVLQITHDLAIGGLQRVIATLCRYFDRDRFDFSVLCLRNLGEYTDDIQKSGVSVTLAGKPGAVDYFMFLKVARFIRKNNFDVIHTHNTQPFLDGGLGNLLAGKRRWIHTDHARNYPDKARYILFEWLIAHFVDCVVGVSEHTSGNLVKYGHISPKKVITIHNGIVPDDFNKRDVDTGRLRSSLGLPPHGPVIGTAVRLSAQKNLGVLIDAFAVVVKTHPSASLVIAGNGPLEDELKCKAGSLGLKNVFFLGPRTDIPYLLQLFDFYVLPSLWEGLPMGVLEAMASKCVIVASDVGGVGSAVTHGINGSLVPPGDVRKLAEELVMLLSNPELVHKYREQGYATFIEKFTGEKMAGNYEALYIKNDDSGR